MHNARTYFQAMATPNAHTSVVTIKRIWDETALRVQVSKSALHRLVGDEIADRAQAVVDNRRARQRFVYPGYTVQSMQQMGFLRFAPRWDECTEVSVLAKHIAGAGTISIMNGVFQSIPAWHPSKLQELVSTLCYASSPTGILRIGLSWPISRISSSKLCRLKAIALLIYFRLYGKPAQKTP